jgi:transcriptional regulator with XRE-family HTH domain
MTPANNNGFTTGKQLARIRNEWLNMSQFELAVCLNCSRNIVSRVEQDKTEYKLSQIQALESLCGGLSINTLLMLPDTSKAQWLLEYAALSPQKRSTFDAMATEAIKLAK